MTLMHTSPDAVPPGPDALTAPACSSAATQPNRPDAWSTQRTLRAEKAQLARWRRLLRARLDLTVAGFAPPEPLGLATWGQVPEAAEAVDQLPDAGELQTAVAGMTTADPVELMTHLRELDRRLGRYDRWVDGALEEATQDSLTRLADGDGR